MKKTLYKVGEYRYKKNNFRNVDDCDFDFNLMKLFFFIQYQY